MTNEDDLRAMVEIMTKSAANLTELSKSVHRMAKMYNARIARLEDAVEELGGVLPDLPVLEELLTDMDFEALVDGIPDIAPSDEDE